MVKVKGHTVRGCTHPHSYCVNRAHESSVIHQSQHQHTDNSANPHVKLGLIGFFKVPLVIKTFDLALMWAITGLLFMVTSCH